MVSRPRLFFAYQLDILLRRGKSELQLKKLSNPWDTGRVVARAHIESGSSAIVESPVASSSSIKTEGSHSHPSHQSSTELHGASSQQNARAFQTGGSHSAVLSLAEHVAAKAAAHKIGWVYCKELADSKLRDDPRIRLIAQTFKRHGMQLTAA